MRIKNLIKLMVKQTYVLPYYFIPSEKMKKQIEQNDENKRITRSIKKEEIQRRLQEQKIFEEAMDKIDVDMTITVVSSRILEIIAFGVIAINE